MGIQGEPLLLMLNQGEHQANQENSQTQGKLQLIRKNWTETMKTNTRTAYKVGYKTLGQENVGCPKQLRDHMEDIDDRFAILDNNYNL